MTVIKYYSPRGPKYLLPTQPKNHQTVAHNTTECCDNLPLSRANSHNNNDKLVQSSHGYKTSELLAKIEELKFQNGKLQSELDTWKSEARAWPRGLGKISPALRRWLEYQEENYGLPDAKQSMENRRYVLGLLKERGLLSDRQRRESRGF